MKPNFDKSFEALYNIAMKMADECIGNKDINARFYKLREEYKELMDEFAEYLVHEKKVYPGKAPFETDKMIGELSDVLFVLLHIAHKLYTTGFELLHMASSKMLSRMADPDYKAKC